MMASRRNPRPIGPRTWMPSSSGPRCAMTRLIRSTVSRQTEAPGGDARKTPAIPHMSEGRGAGAARRAGRPPRARVKRRLVELGVGVDHSLHAVVGLDVGASGLSDPATEGGVGEKRGHTLPHRFRVLGWY